MIFLLIPLAIHTHTHKRISRTVPLFAHLCFCAVLLQSVWPGLAENGSEMSRCPPDPKQHRNTYTCHYKQKGQNNVQCMMTLKGRTYSTCSESLSFSNSSSIDFFCCSCAIFRSKNIQAAHVSNTLMKKN